MENFEAAGPNGIELRLGSPWLGHIQLSEVGCGSWRSITSSTRQPWICSSYFLTTLSIDYLIEI